MKNKMKRNVKGWNIQIELYLVLTFYFLCTVGSIAQDNDVLNSNTSPAFVLMGVSPTEISNPSDLGDFTTSIQNATNNFNTLPTNYAAEFFPYKIFYPDFDYDSSATERFNVFKNIFTSHSISFGFNSDNLNPIDESNFSRIGLGFKTSLIRAKANSGEAANPRKLDQFLAQSASIGINSFPESKVKQLAFFGLPEKIIKQDIFLDMALAFAYDFTGVNHDQMDYSRFGIWLNGGYKTPTNDNSYVSGTFLFTLRYINNQKTEFFSFEEDDLETFDFGIKGNFNALNEDLLVSFEYIWQSILDEGYEDSDKYVLNFSYDIKENMKLGFSVGKDFENNKTREGNLISLINFVSSFGTVDK